MQFIGSLVFTLFLFAWTFFYAIFFVTACLFLPFRQAIRTGAAVGCGAVVGLEVDLPARLSGRGRGERLPPGNHIALWKHSSSWETIAMAVVFPRQVWVLKRELLWVPAVGWGIRQLHAIAIDRKSGHSAVGQVLEQGRQRLAEGDWIIIFPEGTRMPPGQTRKYGVSGTLLAAETGRFLVPVAHNAGSYWPRRGLRKKPGTVRVVIGPPIAAAGRDVRETNREVQEWIEATVSRLTAQE